MSAHTPCKACSKMSHSRGSVTPTGIIAGVIGVNRGGAGVRKGEGHNQAYLSHSQGG